MLDTLVLTDVVPELLIDVDLRALPAVIKTDRITLGCKACKIFRRIWNELCKVKSLYSKKGALKNGKES